MAKAAGTVRVLMRPDDFKRAGELPPVPPMTAARRRAFAERRRRDRASFRGLSA